MRLFHLLKVIASAALFVLAFGLAEASKSAVETRMRALEHEMQEVTSSIRATTSLSATSSPNSTFFQSEQRRTEISSTMVENGYGLDEGSLYMICPAYRHRDHCLHVGGQEYDGNGIDIVAYPNPNTAEQIAIGKRTWQSSLWRLDIIWTLHNRATVAAEVKSESSKWQGQPFYIPASKGVLDWSTLTYIQAAVGWGNERPFGFTNRRWEFTPVRTDDDGRTVWSIKLDPTTQNKGEYLHVGGVIWDLGSVSHDDHVSAHEGSLWVIEKVFTRPAPPSPTTPSAFVPGRYFKICPAVRHSNSCLSAAYSQTRVSVEAEPDASSAFSVQPAQVWQIYHDYGEYFVIESVLHPGQLLHVDAGNREWVTVHPTAPNDGSRWVVSAHDSRDGKTRYAIEPQRFPDSFLHVGGVNWDVGAYNLPASHEGSLWHIEEV